MCSVYIIFYAIGVAYMNFFLRKHINQFIDRKCKLKTQTNKGKERKVKGEPHHLNNAEKHKWSWE